MVIKPPRRRLSILIGTIGSFIAVLGLVIQVKYGTLVFYILMDAFFLPFFLIQLNSSTFNSIDRNHENNMRIEYMINKDLVLNFGRIASVLVLVVLLSFFEVSSSLKGYLLFLSLVPLASGYSLRRLGVVLDGVYINRKRH
jgi:YQGE family putative transporter